MNTQPQRETNVHADATPTTPAELSLGTMREHAVQILEALYLVSAHLSAHDPIVFRMKEDGTSLVDFFVEKEFSEDSDESYTTLKPFLVGIDTALRILGRSGHIKKGNTEIIREQIRIFQNNLAQFSGEEIFENREKESNLENIFSGENHRTSETSTQSLFIGNHAENDQPIFVEKVAPLLRREMSFPTTLDRNKKKALSQKTKPVSQSTNQTDITLKGNETKSARKENILKILRQKKDASISDIDSLFKDCSTKTIQRDLVELIDEGRVVKTGSRRWSLYNLA